MKKGSPSKLNLDKRDDARMKTLTSKYTQPSTCSYSEQHEVLRNFVDLVFDFPIYCMLVTMVAKWKQENKTKASQSNEISFRQYFHDEATILIVQRSQIYLDADSPFLSVHISRN